MNPMKQVQVDLLGNRQRLLAPVFVVAMIAFGSVTDVVRAGACTCDGNVDGVGLVDQGDLFCLVEALRDPGIGCLVGDPDVNCDGTFDHCDVAAVDCLIATGGDPACCDAPCGACCIDGAGEPGIGICGTCRNTTAADCDSGGAFFLCPPAGIYNGDGASCSPSPCDCNGDTIPDGDQTDPTTDCNGNDVLDECEFPNPSGQGACCTTAPDGTSGCADTDSATCTTLGGVYGGDCTSCPESNLFIVIEPGGDIFVHVIGPPVDCTLNPSPSGACPPGPRIDAWESPANGQMCHDFGAVGATPIPADYFAIGSDPFSGIVCLEGLSLNDPLFPGADTLIERPNGDPFDRCDLPSLTTQVTVPIQIQQLSLQSVAPITVTFGGLNPEPWDVFVDLSTLPQPMGSLTATKEHCNGGTYISTLPVQPRFTFTRVGGGPPVSPLDTGIEGQPPIVLQQTVPAPWVSESLLFVTGDPCSDFHAGISDPNPTTDCDCNGNARHDQCDPDGNANGIPDACETGVGIPTVSEWGLVAMMLLILSCGTIVFRRRHSVSKA